VKSETELLEQAAQSLWAVVNAAVHALALIPHRLQGEAEPCNAEKGEPGGQSYSAKPRR
jgi:hypothetical protein